jgi:hypothetical protein
VTEKSDHDLLVEVHTLLVHQVVPGQKDQESRIRGLESRVYWASGFAAAIGVGGGFGLDRLLGHT